MRTFLFLQTGFAAGCKNASDVCRRCPIRLFSTSIANHTKSANTSGLWVTIDGAVMMDGGTHGEIAYAWNDKTRKWVWNGNPNTDFLAQLRSMYDEHHAITADAVYGLYGYGRGTRTTVEAFAAP